MTRELRSALGKFHTHDARFNLGEGRIAVVTCYRLKVRSRVVARIELPAESQRQHRILSSFTQDAGVPAHDIGLTSSEDYGSRNHLLPIDLAACLSRYCLYLPICRHR